MTPLPDGLFPSFPLEDLKRHRALVFQAMQIVFDSDGYVLGEQVARFEQEFAAFLNVGYVVGLASGTDAIEVMLRVLEIGHGSKVVVPTLAPSAVAAGVTRSGAEPLFADIEADAFTLCPESLDAVLRSPAGREVKAAIAVHLYGHAVDWESLQRVADEYGVHLLEDGAQAHGATWRGRKVGTLGKMAAFSFYPTKNLAAIGDAGALATNDAGLAEHARCIRQYGWRMRHISEFSGVNSRLDEVQAAVLRVKLQTLGEATYQRRRLAAQYDSRLHPVKTVLPPCVRGGCDHVYHQYVVRCEQRNQLIEHLHKSGIPTAIHYPLPLHLQPIYRDTRPLPVAEKMTHEILSLPLHPYLTEEAVDAVCNSMEEFDHAGART